MGGGLETLDPDLEAALHLFAEKFSKLRRSSVWHAIEQGEVRFSLRARQGEPVQLEAQGPSEEAVDAFVLTLRFFLQDNESISIRKMADVVEQLPIAEHIKERVRIGRQRFNDFLDRPCGIQIDGAHPTNRVVLETFVYGGMAHANPRKREVFEEWSKQPMIFGVMNQVFFGSLLEILKYVAFLDANLREALDQE